MKGLTCHTNLYPPDVKRLKLAIDLRLIAEQVMGTPARRSNRYIQYHAPARNDSTPSLTIWADGYKDFGGADEASGDVFHFLETYANLPFPAALEFLSGTTSPSLPVGAGLRPAHSTNPEISETGLAPEIRNFLAQAQHALWHTPAGNRARQYLESQGYTPTTIQSRALGLNLRWHKLTGENGEAVWVAPGILYPWFHESTLFGVKIRLPYQRNDQPDELARALNQPPGPMKYMQIAGSRLSQIWYGEIANPALPLILVEGEKDRDNLWQRCGDDFNIITLGSATGRLPERLLPYLAQAAWVAVILDNDTAGQTNARRLADTINHHLPSPTAFVAAIPAAHKDLTDWLLAEADENSLLTWLTSLCPQINLAEGQATYHFANGLPDPLRETLLSLHQLTPQGRSYIADHSAAALVLELFYEATRENSLPPTDSFTIQSLANCAIQLNRATSAKTIRRGLDQLCALGLMELIPFSTPYKLISNENQRGENGKNSVEGSTRGRPAQHYRACDLQTALPQFLAKAADRLRESLFADTTPDEVDPAWFADFDDPHHLTEIIATASDEILHLNENDPAHEKMARLYQTRLAELTATLEFKALCRADSTRLPRDVPFVSGRDYRDVYYQAKVAAAGEFGRQIPRAKAAAEIGVNSRTLSRVRERTGVITEQQFKEYAITDPTNILDQADFKAKWAANRPYGRFLTSTSGERIPLYIYNPTQNDTWVAAQFAQGHTVRLQIQIASREHLVTPAAATEQRQRRSTKFRAALATRQCAALPLPFSEKDTDSPSLNSEMGLQICSPSTAQWERGSGGEGSKFAPAPVCPARFTPAYVRDQLALRLPYLADYWPTDEILRATLQAALCKFGLLLEVGPASGYNLRDIGTYIDKAGQP